MTIPTHIAQTLTDLRLRRDYLDQAIHVLSSIWEAPAAAQVDTVVETPRPVKQLTPVAVKRASGRAGANSQSDNNAVLAAVRKLGRATKATVMAETKMDGPRVQRAKVRLEKAGTLVVDGRARQARWTLAGRPPAKEAP